MLVKKSESAGVLKVSINRPDVKNAMSAEVISELKAIFSKLSKTTKLIVLTGEGEFFCAGGDLNWMKSALTKTKKENEKDARELGKMIRALDECSVPVITIVKGGAFGGGVGLVAASDIVIAEEKTIFSLSEVKLGLIPATIGPIVMRKIGVSQARRLYLSGMRFSAQEAKAMNLVHDVCAAQDIESTLQKYLKEFETSGPDAIRVAKGLIRDLQQGDMWKEGISEETSKILSKVRVGKEAQEGITAFLERRKASWLRNFHS